MIRQLSAHGQDEEARKEEDLATPIEAGRPEERASVHEASVQLEEDLWPRCRPVGHFLGNRKNAGLHLLLSLSLSSCVAGR